MDRPDDGQGHIEEPARPLVELQRGAAADLLFGAAADAFAAQVGTGAERAALGGQHGAADAHVLFQLDHGVGNVVHLAVAQEVVRRAIHDHQPDAPVPLDPQSVCHCPVSDHPVYSPDLCSLGGSR